VKNEWLEDVAELGAGELSPDADELRPLELLPIVNGDKGLPLDDEAGPGAEVLDDEALAIPRLAASLIDPSRVVTVTPLSLVTEPGLARVPELERVLTTIECEG